MHDEYTMGCSGEGKTRGQKLLEIMENLKKSSVLGFRNNVEVRLGEEVVTYYYVDSSFFQIDYQQVKVNIVGIVETKGINVRYDLDAWLNNLLRITEQQVIVVGGKKYALTEVKE